ncbi:MAG: hypothetical protein ACODAF_09040 [Actinomycetota bacterium]
MAIAALVTWLIAAVGGFYMLAGWMARGGTRDPEASRFSPMLILSHFILAAAGLVLWIVYLVSDITALAWIALILLLPVAVLGFTMFARWLPSYQARAEVATGGATGGTARSTVAEAQFPVVVVGAHGLFAVATVVLVLLATLGVGT